MTSPDPARLHVTLMRDSLLRCSGIDLFEALKNVEADPVAAVFEAPFGLVSHDRSADPVFTYANATALSLFEMDIAAFTSMPSRLSAEPDGRDERQRLLDDVARSGFASGYSGVRISATGRRFRIEDALLWNLVELDGRIVGQAAKIPSWTWL